VSLDTTPSEVLARRLRASKQELDEYQAACARDGGWPTTDARTLRMGALGDEIDQLDRVLMEREYLDAHEDTDDHDQI